MCSSLPIGRMSAIRQPCMSLGHKMAEITWLLGLAMLGRLKTAMAITRWTETIRNPGVVHVLYML